jgi:hypothetical protein
MNTDLQDLIIAQDKLTQFKMDLPVDSVAVVGYTLSTFQKGGDMLKSVSFNVHWVMALSVPEEEDV